MMYRGFEIRWNTRKYTALDEHKVLVAVADSRADIERAVDTYLRALSNDRAFGWHSARRLIEEAR